MSPSALRPRRPGSSAAPLFPMLALAALALLAAAPASAQFGKNKIQYREFEWQIYHSPHFDIYHYEEEKAHLEKMASFAESAYDRLSREFDHQIAEPVPLIFYLTHSQFEQNNIILNFIPEGVGAFASPVRNRMVLPIDLEDGELFALVMHELTHIFQYDILFRGKLSRGIAGNVPQWFMEGMASYMAKDESTSDQMFLRDAVVNDRVPSILERGVTGFLAYRFGHAAFDYIEERWGKEGFRDFVYEFRNTFGGRAERAVERSFRVDPEDFDLDFRRWLRKKYLPRLVETGEPSDFGRPFRDREGDISSAISPTASPSGDLVAAFATTRGDLDIVLWDTRSRRPIANLTKGYTSDYQYLVSQFVTAAARMGRDLAFSSDGNFLAAFAKREEGRSLLIFDVLDRKLVRRIDMDVEQQHGPAFSPDGKTIAFTGNRGGQFDVFLIDLESEQITNLTNDAPYDGAPTYSPDGSSIVFSVASGEDNAHLFRVDLADPTKRYRLTDGDWRDKDAIYSSTGQAIVFTSDRSGADNIYAMELATGRTIQLTNVVTGCFMPTLLPRHDAIDQLVYTGFWKGGFDLYLGDLEKALSETTEPLPATDPTPPEEIEVFEPDIRVSLDPANTEEYGGFRLFLEDAGASAGVTDDQTLLGYTYISMSDYLGNRRLTLLLSAVESFSNFNVQYVDLSRRFSWGVEIFDNRDFYVTDLSPVQGDEDQQQELQFTGAIASYIYPFTLYHRASLGAGYIYQKQTLFFPNQNPETGEIFIDSLDQKFDYPLVQAAFVGDSSLLTENGPISGRRYRLQGQYAFDMEESGDLYTRVDLDFRQYFEVSLRSSIALRLFAGYSDGNISYPYYFGGLDDLRGVGFRTIVGDRAFFANFEYRFPLIDYFAFPGGFGFRGIRGRVFLDVGGAWNDRLGQDFDFWDSEENRLDDAISSYGFGLSLYFAGIQLNWDFARLWDWNENLDDSYSTQFWIGSRF